MAALFRFHLSTAILLSLLVAVVMMLNFCPEWRGNEDTETYRKIGYGWPLTIVLVEDQDNHRILASGIVFNLTVCAILLLVAFISLEKGLPCTRSVGIQVLLFALFFSVLWSGVCLILWQAGWPPWIFPWWQNWRSVAVVFLVALLTGLGTAYLDTLLARLTGASPPPSPPPTPNSP
jgi:hypothetical protein